MTSRTLIVRQAHSAQPDAEAAVAELARELDSANASMILFFCSPRYNLKSLGDALRRTFSSPVSGCTSAGQIDRSGYRAQGGITAVSLTSSALRATPFLISQLQETAEVIDVGYRAVGELVRRSSSGAFGLLLIDGLSCAEERVAAALHQSLGDVPLIGGSAADELEFRQTHVYHDGEFLSRAATFVLFDTSLPFAAFSLQSAVPTSDKLVVTSAEPRQRRVLEINGKRAVKAYAEKLGADPARLTAADCARRPLLLQAGGEHYVRGVRAVNSDGSLSLWCAIEEGAVLSLGAETSGLDALEREFAAVERRIGPPALVIGMDCVTRRLQHEARAEAAAVGDLLSRHRVVGFCTYGEQFDSLHLSQTFTGMALGGG